VLQRLNEVRAQKVLAKFFEDRDSWKLLDKTGTYKAAVRRGLHDTIREALGSDRDTLHDRYRAGQVALCYTPSVMMAHFRANRAEGNNPNYSGMDGQRIKAYVTSHPDALFTWLGVSSQLLMALLDAEVVKNSKALSSLRTKAILVWKGWMDVFTSPVASRAVLLPPPTSAAGTSKTGTHEKAQRKRQHRARVDHATKIVSIPLEAVYLPWADCDEEPEQLAGTSNFLQVEPWSMSGSSSSRSLSTPKKYSI
jgi:hypothetical protein